MRMDTQLRTLKLIGYISPDPSLDQPHNNNYNSFQDLNGADLEINSITLCAANEVIHANMNLIIHNLGDMNWNVHFNPNRY